MKTLINEILIFLYQYQIGTYPNEHTEPNILLGDAMAAVLRIDLQSSQGISNYQQRLLERSHGAGPEW